MKCIGNCLKCELRKEGEVDEFLCPLNMLIRRTNTLKESHAEIIANQTIIIDMLRKVSTQKTSSMIDFEIEDEPLTT